MRERKGGEGGSKAGGREREGGRGRDILFFILLSL